MRCLRGCPDYTIWYHADAEKKDLAVNFVILQRKEGRSLRYMPQTLAYIGKCFHPYSIFISSLIIYLAMIHTQRRYEEKVEHTIFGLSTDGIQFHFLQIDCKGKVIKSTSSTLS